MATSKLPNKRRHPEEPDQNDGDLADGTEHLSGLSDQIRRSTDPAEKKAMVELIAQYAVTLASEHQISVPGNISDLRVDALTGLQVRPKRRRTDPGSGPSSDGGEISAAATDPDKTSKVADADEDASTSDPEDVAEVEDALSRGEGDETAPTAVPKRARAAAGPITLGISSEFGVERLLEARDAFRRDVGELRLTITKYKKVYKNQRFTPGEIDEITDLFFGEIIGPLGLNRLISLITLYQQENEGEPDRGAGQRAERLTMDHHIPQIVRRFFGAFREAEAGKINTSSNLFQLHQMRKNITLLEKFNQLKAEAENGNAVVRSFLAQQGYQTKKGVTWTSCVFRYIKDSLEIQKDAALWNSVQAALGIKELVQSFGYGILPLIPNSAPNKLNRWGNRRMVPVYAILRQHLRGFDVVCQVIQSHLYDPIVSGRPIGMKGLECGEGGSETMLERINRAVAGAAGDQVTAAITESADVDEDMDKDVNKDVNKDNVCVI